MGGMFVLTTPECLKSGPECQPRPPALAVPGVESSPWNRAGGVCPVSSGTRVPSQHGGSRTVTKSAGTCLSPSQIFPERDDLSHHGIGADP